MKIAIRHRWTGAVIFTAEVEDGDLMPMRTDLARAYLAGANLAGANLAGANLARAYLAGAYLDGANLAGANLDGAYLARANLDGANLAGANLAGANLDDAYLARANLDGANLAGANLAGANLDGAYLARAYLAGAYLDGANLDGAYLAGANLDGAYLDGANRLPSGFAHADPPEPYQLPDRSETRARRAQRYRERHPEVPVVERLDARILEIVESGAGQLDMSQWHACETTHCRAGWAITLAGPAGKALEDKHGSHRAGLMIYLASTGTVPHFFAPDQDALTDLRRCAARDAAPTNEAGA